MNQNRETSLSDKKIWRSVYYQKLMLLYDLLESINTGMIRANESIASKTVLDFEGFQKVFEGLKRHL